MFHFLQSELLSRRLAYFCSKRISLIFNEYSSCFFKKELKYIEKKLTTSNNTNSTSQQSQIIESVQQHNNNNELLNYILRKNISIKSVTLFLNQFK